MTSGIRRLVTGLYADGRSNVLFDDRAPEGTQILWQSPQVPADNAGGEDTITPFSFDIFRSRGTTFLLAQMQPGESDGPYMHATDTLDYLIVIRGRVRLTVETGSVDLDPGDCIVDRGVIHGWEVLGDEPVIMATALMPAGPVASGATI